MIDAPTATTFMLTPSVPSPETGSVLEDDQTFDSTIVYEAAGPNRCSVRKVAPFGATLRGDVSSRAGDDVSLELTTGQRVGGTVIWTEGRDFGVRFTRSVDVLALITRNLVNQPTERRSMPRVELRCGAWLRKEQEFAPVILRNISASGLQLEGDDLPETGEAVQVFVEGLGVPPGEIIWRRDKVAGVQLHSELSWMSILPWIRQLTDNGR